ncbi:hypothetical protein [Aquincola tertiaricarbonis]|uniref:hypothetical protein n=1 Tax=Aquincola tertiaricarbonis TaxID=391953 RepID=UPI0012EEBE8F|nr:hypothetical protein [Aquincola tertiaricarbonis]
MRSAPAVQVDLGDDLVWRGAVAICCGSALAALAAWAAGWAELSVRWTAAAALLAAGAGACFGRFWLPAPAGVLCWDGRQWLWDGRPGDLRVVFDLGPWLLMCFSPAGQGRAAHLPLSRAAARAGWHGLRAAVYSRRPEPRTPSAPRM